MEHKSHTTKVIFLGAVARLHYTIGAGANIDGNIVTPSFTRQVAAEGSSSNTVAGTMDIKIVDVAKEVYKRKLVDEVIPVINTLWARLWASRAMNTTPSEMTSPLTSSSATRKYKPRAGLMDGTFTSSTSQL